MVDVLAFIQNYYYLLVLVLILVVLVLEIIISRLSIKNPSILSAIDKILPELILEAEKRFSLGSDKLNFVISRTEDAILNLFDVKNLKQYEKYIKNGVEKILSCPQKKGEN